MATEQVTVVEGDGSVDTVTVTDDPVENQTVKSVQEAIGDETIASQQSDSTVAATLLERVTALVDVLTSGQADDEVRVALASDLLTGNLDVNLNAQSGNIRVDLAADSLTGGLDVDLAEISHGTVTVTDDGSFVVSDIPATAPDGAALPGTAVVVAGDDGTDTRLFQLRGDDLKVSVENDEIDLPTETTLSAVKAAVEAIDDALGSNATDTIRVSSPSDLDVNLSADSLASALDVDLAGQSAAPIQVELSSDALAGNLNVDLAAASAEPLDVSASPVGIKDSGGTQIDPATSSDVGAVEAALGDETTVSQQADSTLSATLIERVTALVDALTSGQADDEVRVALATDLLSGNIDVDIANQSSGNLTVELAADSLTGNLDVDLATQTSEPLDVSGATVPTEQQSPIQLESSSGTNIDPATESTVDAIKAAAQALDDALASNGTDEIRVTSPSPLDASAAEIDVDLNSQSLSAVSVDLASDSLANPIDVDLASASAEPLDVSGATVPTEQQSPVKIEDSGGTSIDPATEQKLETVRSLLDKLDDALASVASDTLRTEQQSPVGIEDNAGTQVDPATSSDVQAVESAVGDESTASQEADSSLSATAIERLTALMDALESGRATDEIRVSSVRGATPVPTPIVERQIVSTAGSPEAVRGSTTSLGSGAEVRALPTNSGNAYVWISSGSKSESRILTPGDEVFLPTSDLSNVIVDVDTGGEGVSVVAA